MKKNWTMKVAALMLALTMITACFVGSTFAKYVTRAQGEDNARVAKWGVLLTMESDLFDTTYEADDNTFVGQGDDYTNPAISVASVNEDKVVAPGTTNDGFKATIVGTPEVAVRYTLHIEPDWKDVVLPAKNGYTDFTKIVENPNYDPEDPDSVQYGYFGTFDLAKDYSPVKWDISVSKNGGDPIKLSQVAQAYPALAAAMGGNAYGFSATNAKAIVEQYHDQLEALMLQILNSNGEAGASNAKFTVNQDGSIDLSIDFDPNRSLNFEFGLVWTWPFEQGNEIEDGIYEFDAADTWLGNYAAYKKFGECADYAQEFDAANASYEISFKFVATATQID